MYGLFGGVLQSLATCGLAVQHATRKTLYLLIGDAALRWNLEDLKVVDPDTLASIRQQYLNAELSPQAFRSKEAEYKSLEQSRSRFASQRLFRELVGFGFIVIATLAVAGVTGFLSIAIAAVLIAALVFVLLIAIRAGLEDG